MYNGDNYMWVTYASGACKWLGWQTKRLQLQLQLQLRLRLRLCRATLSSAVTTQGELRPLDLSNPSDCGACHIVSKHRKIREEAAVFLELPFCFCFAYSWHAPQQNFLRFMQLRKCLNGLCTEIALPAPTHPPLPTSSPTPSSLPALL